MKKIILFISVIFFAVSLSANPNELFNRAADAYRNGSYSQAALLYTECLKKIESNRRHFVYNNRGLAYKNLKQPGNAMKDFMSAIRLKPDYAPAYNNIGLLFLDQGDYRKALKLFNRSLEYDGDYFIAYYNIACVYSILKKPAVAVRFLVQAEKSASRRSSYLRRMYQEMISDRQLDNLRKYPPFQKLMKKIERKLRIQRI